MTDYQRKKQAARDAAIEWQLTFGEYEYSYNELAEQQRQFEKIAKRYGLIREFRENGII